MCIIFLFLFAFQRNANRDMSNVNIQFSNNKTPFISHQTVNNLLIEKHGSIKNINKEQLDLDALEYQLKSNPMIHHAEVFATPSGILDIHIRQKTPIARVYTHEKYYIDSTGAPMPLSNNYSARVPLVTGYVSKHNLKHIYALAQKINQDAFLKQHVYEIYQDDEHMLYLKLRACQFIVQIGKDTTFLDKKIDNLKAFYKKTLNSSIFNAYSKVNLQFENQVICTKH